MRSKCLLAQERGFTFYELMIVVGILLILATIAIPSYLQSRQTANEAGAIGSLRTVFTSETVYSSDHQNQSADLPTLVTSGALLDSRFATADTKSISGYFFKPGSVAPTGGKLEVIPNGFNIQAFVNGRAGRYEFFIQSDGTIRYADGVNGNPLPAGLNPGDPLYKNNF
ncbi:MAG: prepilin-type N-terminal cleavage/methylation domain-containing protein [Acidobacteriia bacterium]|nr:prepilin-type N-terminal cleavage/methylation domain-containing protein [Terriglobia bacterium]